MEPHYTMTPARARTDVRGSTPVPAQAGPAPITAGRVRRLGLGLAAGTLIWAATIFLFDPSAGGTAGRIGDLGGLAFQIGLFGLLRVQSRTGATGTSGASSIMLRIEAVLLALASVWSLLHAILPEAVGDSVLLGVLDLFWPLSMFGMFVISVKLLVARRWRGLLRWWPLVAESWAVATVPAYVLLGDGAPRWFGGGHLLVGYTMLGLLLARRPEDALPAREAADS
ncbi:hypothetical protein IL992_36835 [Microbispora sp. NEAU-D428]|uniref:hypothetical protein n=1 Tax=Microbispora sitophila TaxID=2771537 RepID=UPI00186759E7|nr:hypothetical protein [Microbispora sitophila]MBE3014703.1 hypothetical protein [Microbispora sitophila]